MLPIALSWTGLSLFLEIFDNQGLTRGHISDTQADSMPCIFDAVNGVTCAYFREPSCLEGHKEDVSSPRADHIGHQTFALTSAFLCASSGI